MFSLSKLTTNLRFYVLTSSLLLSVIVICYLRLIVPDSELFLIRSQQVLGLLAVLYLFAATILSPLSKITKGGYIDQLLFARRAIGVSAFYFALLHSAIAIWGQLGGPGQLSLLPNIFIWSFIFGGVALLFLEVMALTSFNAVISFMSPRRWKLLHRLVYLSVVLIVLHVWTIGTHLADPTYQWLGFIALAILTGLEIIRFGKALNRKYLHLSSAELTGVVATAYAVVLLLIASLPVLVNNYHSKHEGHNSTNPEELR